MHKYLKLAMDAIKNNIIAVVIVLGLLVGVFIVLSKKEGLTVNKDYDEGIKGDEEVEVEDSVEDEDPLKEGITEKNTTDNVTKGAAPMLTKEEAEKLVQNLMKLNAKANK